MQGLRELHIAQSELRVQLRAIEAQLVKLRDAEYALLAKRNTFRRTITLSKANWEKIELSSHAETFIHDSSDEKWLEITIFSNHQSDIDATKV